MTYGQAEEFLGSWLAGRGSRLQDVTVGSKWGYTYTANWRLDAQVHEVKDLSIETLRRQLAESTELLGSHLCLYQIHSATLESGVLDDPAVLEELGRLRARGLSIGCTVTGPRQGDRASTRGGRLRRSAGDMEPVRASGRPGARRGERCRRGSDRQGGARERTADRPRRRSSSGRRSRRLGTTADALALAAVLAQPWLDVVLSGAATPEMLPATSARPKSRSAKSFWSGWVPSVRIQRNTGTRGQRAVDIGELEGARAALRAARPRIEWGLSQRSLDAAR